MHIKFLSFSLKKGWIGAIYVTSATCFNSTPNGLILLLTSLESFVSKTKWRWVYQVPPYPYNDKILIILFIIFNGGHDLIFHVFNFI